ncbi:MAG: Gfo/Idh/MocA family oxidoreductase [Planctomycetes bacterium]|nr:Gfo/Idh/MocA family oxidoreductase [Planctomycetota bacterium]
MSTRREFVGSVLAGAAALTVSGAFPSRRVLGANERIRVGLIGAGGRGQEIFKSALQCPGTEAAAVADVYTRRLEEVKKYAPQVKTYQDFRKLLDDRSIDAVLIATPQHQHVLNFVPALQAGKDVYQEKTMAFNPDHAKRMRKAFQGSGRVVQIGIQSTSSDAVARAKEHLTPDKMGTITAIHTHHYRNAPYGGWKRAVPADCDEQHVDWLLFQGEAKKYPFDPNRVINWRFYWDYAGGNVYENMVHQVGFWYKLLGLKIPARVTMTGANYLSPEMQVPDTMDVSMSQPENLLFTWNSMFGNRYFGEGDDLVLGNKGTVLRDDHDQVRYEPQNRPRGATPAAPAGPGGKKSADIVAGGDATVAHLQNFFDCLRTRRDPNCPFEIGFRSAIACYMAITSYRQNRTVRWDEKTEEVV